MDGVVTPATRRFGPEWLVFAVIVVDLIGFGLVIPILPFMAPILGGDEMDVAMVIAVYSLCAGLFGPFWGGLSDRIGRKRVLMICLFGGALSYGMLGAATELWMLYAARAFGGVMAGSLPVASALMADVSAPHRRAKAMGLVGTAFGLGLILGPVIGGVLAGPENRFLWPGLFAAAMSLASVVLAGLLLPMDKPDRHRAEQTQRHSQRESILVFTRQRRALLLSAQYILHTGAVSSAIYLSPLWLAAFLDWGPREVGILFGLVGVVMIVVQGALLDWMTRTLGLLNVLTTGAVIFAASLLAAVVVESEFARASVVFLAFAGATCCLPILNTIASSIVTADERGRMMGITALAASIGRVLGPLLTGLVLAAWNYGTAWSVLALPVLLVVIWSRTAASRYAGDAQRQAPDT
ncbi:MAG: MFS transporter [Luminiphilus sp.]